MLQDLRSMRLLCQQWFEALARADQCHFREGGGTQALPSLALRRVHPEDPIEALELQQQTWLGTASASRNASLH